MFFHHNAGNDESRKLPGAVRDYMRRRFILRPDYLDELKCFESEGLVNGEPVKSVSIFNQVKARAYRVSIRTRQDLEKHPELLLFEGHVDNRGKAYVADRRPPLKQITKQAA